MTTLSRIIGILILTILIFLTSCSSDDDTATIPVSNETMTNAELTAYFTTLAEK